MATDLALAMAADYLFGDNLATAKVEREKLAEVCALIRKIRGNSYPVPGISGIPRMSVNKDWLYELGQLIGDEK